MRKQCKSSTCKISIPWRNVKHFLIHLFFFLGLFFVAAARPLKLLLQPSTWPCVKMLKVSLDFCLVDRWRLGLQLLRCLVVTFIGPQVIMLLKNSIERSSLVSYRITWTSMCRGSIKVSSSFLIFSWAFCLLFCNFESHWFSSSATKQHTCKCHKAVPIYRILTSSWYRAPAHIPAARAKTLNFITSLT